MVPRMVWALLRVTGFTWRFEVIAEEGVTPVVYGQKAGPEIYCFWHQCVLPCTLYFRRLTRGHPDQPELRRRIDHAHLRMFGFDAVRGSSSRGAREGTAGTEAGDRVAGAQRSLPPMGRGVRSIKPRWAPSNWRRLTGAPIGAFHLEPERAWTVRSWDHFLVPKPFTRICVSWAQWTHVPARSAFG